MTAAHIQNFHHPVNHNSRVKRLIRKFDNRLKSVHSERMEIIDREDRGEKLCFADQVRCSELFLEIQDLSRTISQLESLVLPEEN